jgi:hypothetical protein
MKYVLYVKPTETERYRCGPKEVRGKIDSVPGFR